MLASLLPGIRHLRAPLAAGIISAAAIYLFSYKTISSAIDTQRFSLGLQSLLELLGSKGLIAVLVAAAYLTGTILVGLMHTTVRRLNLALLGVITREEYLHPSRRGVGAHPLAPFSRPSLLRLKKMCRSDALFRNVCKDILVGGGIRLLVSNRDLYAEYDRLRAEADFRDAIGGPMVVLVAAILPNANWSGLFETLLLVGAVLGAVTLVYQARGIEKIAYSMYAHSVADGVVSTASLDALKPSRPRLRRPD